MNKTFARDLQLFIAGAVALMGFRSLILLPFYFTSPMNAVRIGGIIGLIVGSLGLPIGVIVFKGYRRAMFAAQAYVCFNIIATGIVVALVWKISPEDVKRAVLKYAYDWLTNIVLLGLIFWSRSRRFKLEPHA